MTIAIETRRAGDEADPSVAVAVDALEAHAKAGAAMAVCRIATSGELFALRDALNERAARAQSAAVLENAIRPSFELWTEESAYPDGAGWRLVLRRVRVTGRQDGPMMNGRRS